MEIGHAACLKFASEGYAIAFNDYNVENGNKALEELKDKGYEAIFLPGDATKEEEVKAMVAKTVDTYGRIDTLINNAGGLGGRSSFEGMETEFWNRVMDLNLNGAFFAARECIPYLKTVKGTMINITTIAAYNGGGPGAGVYAAAKGSGSDYDESTGKGTDSGRRPRECRFPGNNQYSFPRCQ